MAGKGFPFNPVNYQLVEVVGSNPLMTIYDPMLSSDPVLHTDLQSQMVYFENPENIANLSYESDATKQDAEVG